ncbi:alpha/beta fold hydrolase [Aestuariivirga sp.]|uniref:alpha/beta fold hydrolase n=1 Tax=Aestuariivirga sp. TaxID=2650926 RepID=UPI00391C542F
MSLRNRRVNVTPEIELDLAESGPVNGRPVILIPGLSDSWPSYLPLMREMPGDLRLISFSLRGHGDSGKTPPGYGLSDMAGDVLAAMDLLGISRADVVGHSLGSMVAQKLVQLAPSRCTSLTLIGAFVRMQSNPAVVSLHEEVILPLADPVDPAFVRGFQESAVGPATSCHLIEDVVAESLKLRADDWKAALGAAMAADLTTALSDFAGPVLVLHGQLDDFCLPEEQIELTRGMRRQLISRPDWGHSPHWEMPADTAANIAQFLGSVAAWPTTAKLSM